MIRTIEEKEIDKKFETLKQFCTNCTPDELDKLDAAYRYAAKVYGDKINSSGELLISHSLSVARIVAEEIGLRSVSLIAALLHDVINTADDNCEEIESKFGKDVATIVRGFKKVSVIDSEKVKLHSENFRSLFLSMIDDVRVIFIKIAHQLYDLRNYSSLTEFQKKIFLNDVQYLYIPITHRMGLYHIKAQLEDMAFRHSYPVEYSKIESRLHETKEQQEKYIEKFIRPIKEQFDKSGISTVVEAFRAMSPFINFLNRALDEI
jgi:guanosine-3',5'-bis(diphosphate) 3'-pyrophosphohydrolase